MNSAVLLDAHNMNTVNMKQLRISSVHTISLCILFFLLLAGCANGKSERWQAIYTAITHDFPYVPLISTSLLQLRMEELGEDRPILLDTRSPEEYAISHLQGAYLATTLDEAVNIIVTLGTDRPVVTYCSVGFRSAGMAKQLIDRGFQRVYNLEGSIFKWANEGRELYQEDKQVSFVHPHDDEWGQLLNRKLRYTGK